MSVNTNMQNRCFVTIVKSDENQFSSKLLTLECEHNFSENETVIAIAEKDFNVMQALLEDRRKRIKSFEIMLEELKTDQNTLILQQEKEIHKLDNECTMFKEQSRDLKSRLDELYNIYDGLNIKYEELDKNFNFDAQMRLKLDEVKEMLRMIYHLKERQPLGYLKKHVKQSYIPLNPVKNEPNIG